MTVSSYSLYVKACTDLARSIVIKNEDIAEAMNKHDAAIREAWIALGRPAYHLSPYNKRTWRYYLHLAGEYHALDEPMTVISADTGEEIPFTKASLQIHRSTKRYYQRGTTYYRNLVNRYPKQRDLIDGILYPVDIDQAINATNYQILRYDESLVESNEYTLIEKIQKHIYAFFDRWDNPDYVLTDDLYVPAKIGIFYIYLPYLIMNFRYEVARTNEAHSFHLWNYLGSHLHLDDFKLYLNRYQALWFHRNIRWVENNPGKMKTFLELIDVVLTKRNIPLAEFLSRFDYTKVLEKAEDVAWRDGEKVHDIDALYPDVQWERKPLNLEDMIPKEGSIRSTEEIIRDQIHQARDNPDYLDSDIRDIRYRFRRHRVKRNTSKVLESSLEDVTKRQAIRVDDVALNEWIHLTCNNLYHAKITAHNPKTAEMMSLTQKDALILFIYSLHQMSNIHQELIPTIIASDVLRLRKPDIDNVAKVFDHYYADYNYVFAADHYVWSPDAVFSTEAFAEHVDNVVALKNLHRNLYSFTGDAREHLQVKVLRDQYYQNVICYLTEEKTYFKDYFKAQGWKLDGINKEEWASLNLEITRTALGKDLIKKTSIKSIQENMIRLLKRLSSYSVNFVTKITGEDIYVLDWGYHRYHDLGTLLQHLNQVRLTSLHARRHKVRLYQDSRCSLLPNFVSEKDHRNGISYGYSRIDLILNLDNGFKTVSRSVGKLPTVNVGHVDFHWEENRVVEPAKSHWDPNDFRIHRGTEARSGVHVDKDDNLIVRGVVYVRNDKLNLEGEENDNE